MRSRISRRCKDLLWKLWYPVLTRLTRNSPVTFLNYGYADDGMAATAPALSEQDQPDRPCIQLYHHVVGIIDLAGLDVLEVSCGHGGGASYLTRYLFPHTMHGVDRNVRAIELCKRMHQAEGLTFSCGDAQALRFRDETFDAVINIEASHCYPDMPRFLREVHRVLQPGGHFLFADFRDKGPDRLLLHQQLEASGIAIIRCQDISANVVRGMQFNSQKYEGLIRRLVPWFLRKPAVGFAGVKGSAIYKALESRETVYLCYHLQKPFGPPKNKA